MKTTRVEQSIGSHRAIPLCSIVDPSKLDETVPPIGKLTDDNSYRSEFGVSVRNSFCQVERGYTIQLTINGGQSPPMMKGACGCLWGRVPVRETSSERSLLVWRSHPDSYGPIWSVRTPNCRASGACSTHGKLAPVAQAARAS